MSKPYLDDGDVVLYHGDCVEVMRAMPAESVDAVVCDPPYDLTAGKRGGSGEASVNLDSPYGRARIGTGNGGGFMGKAWDATGVAFDVETWRAVLHVLKPGGHVAAFGGTRTFHRMAVAVEDAGFEIRDTLCWLYGSGFPKSLDVSKAIDKAAGAERTERADPRWAERYPNGNGGAGSGHTVTGAHTNDGPMMTSDPATPDAERWQGWGTALKPAYEPVILARKPLRGTVAANVLAHGTGALNIDATRIPTDDRWEATGRQSAPSVALQGGADGSLNVSVSETHAAGRWPANVLLDEEAAAMLDAQTGEMKSPAPYERGPTNVSEQRIYGNGKGIPLWSAEGNYGDSGGASRFFYTAKASRAERNDGLHHLPAHDKADQSAWGRTCRVCGCSFVDPATGKPKCAHDDFDWTQTRPAQNHHPTVKPVTLMRWLCRLVTPPGGVILDPFIGSGSTAVAARAEGFRCWGIDQDAEYLAIAAGRLSQLSLLGGEGA